MPLTPDRFPGSREEDEIIIEEQTTDPTIDGSMRYVSGEHRFKDSVGIYNPRHGLGKQLINNLKLKYLSSNTIQIGLGTCNDKNDVDFMEVSSTITVDITTSGINGLDSGSEAANTWYHVWLIKNSSTGVVAGLLSIDPEIPTMPIGWDRRRRIGTVRNDNSSDILEFIMFGVGRWRKIHYIEGCYSSLQILSGGSSTYWIDVNCSTLIPSTSRLGCFMARAYGTSPYSMARIRYNGTIEDNFQIIAATSVYDTASFEMPLDENQILEYVVSSTATLNLSVLGYIEEI